MCVCVCVYAYIYIYIYIYKASNLIISNNTFPTTELLDWTNVVYMFKCPFSGYVGLTTTTLSR